MYGTMLKAMGKPIKKLNLSDQIYYETHSITVLKSKLLMLYWIKFSICAEIHTKYTNTLRGQNIGYCKFKHDGT